MCMAPQLQSFIHDSPWPLSFLVVGIQANKFNVGVIIAIMNPFDTFWFWSTTKSFVGNCVQSLFPPWPSMLQCPCCLLALQPFHHLASAEGECRILLCALLLIRLTVLARKQALMQGAMQPAAINFNIQLATLFGALRGESRLHDNIATTIRVIQYVRWDAGITRSQGMIHELLTSVLALHYARRRRKKGCDWCVVTSLEANETLDARLHLTSIFFDIGVP
jgi:hypothetical protein